MGMARTDTTREAHLCLPCRRPLKSADSITRGYGTGCWAKDPQGGAHRRPVGLDRLSGRGRTSGDRGRRGGAEHTREGVFHVVSADGSEVHRTAEHGCNCTNGLKTRAPRPCWHRCAVAIVLATSVAAQPPATAPALVAFAAPAAPVLTPPDDFWAALDATTEAFMAMA
jgi:hypothetical protein